MFEKQLGSLLTGTEVREREEGDQERMVREREGKGKPISAHSTVWHPLSHKASSPFPRTQSGGVGEPGEKEGGIGEVLGVEPPRAAL